MYSGLIKALSRLFQQTDCLLLNHTGFQFKVVRRIDIERIHTDKNRLHVFKIKVP